MRARATGPLTVTCEIYAWDLSVRGAHLDETHALFNGTSVFLLPLGHENAPCEIDILPPDGAQFADWQVATALEFVSQTPAPARLADKKTAASRAGAGVSESGLKPFGCYRAGNYQELIDHPVEMGRFSHASFEVSNVMHHVVITGRHRADLPRLCADLQKICEAQVRLFEPASAKPPFDEFWFLILAMSDVPRGGLEHRASCVLLCHRDELPLANEKKISTGYRQFLVLASHEYFHSWNVKRIKPEAFVDYNLSRENYTRQLWFFEGVTSYYDELMLIRTRLVEPLAYLEMVAEHIGRVHMHSGRLKQSVAEASFDAWVKFYRLDENSPNVLANYYEKGALVGMALDFIIRERSNGEKSLDDVMRALWNEHGKTGAGVPEGGIQVVAERIAGGSLADFFETAVYGTEDIDLAAHFEKLAVDLTWKIAGQMRPDDTPPATLGARISADPNGDARLFHLFDHGAAQLAGMAAGDVVIAVDGLRATGATLERRVRTYAIGSRIAITAFRRDELMTFEVTLQPLAAHTCSLVMRDTPIDAKVRRNAWMFG